MKIQIQLSTSTSTKISLSDIKKALAAYSKKHGEHPVKLDSAHAPKKVARSKNVKLILIFTDTEDSGQYAMEADYDEAKGQIVKLGSAPEENFDDPNGDSAELKKWLRTNTTYQYK